MRPAAGSPLIIKSAAFTPTIGSLNVTVIDVNVAKVPADGVNATPVLLPLGSKAAVSRP